MLSPNQVLIPILVRGGLANEVVQEIHRVLNLYDAPMRLVSVSIDAGVFGVTGIAVAEIDPTVPRR